MRQCLTQYLRDRELRKMLAELKRMTRPGGLVAIKEFDGTFAHFMPIDPLAQLAPFAALTTMGETQVLGALRPSDMSSVWIFRMPTKPPGRKSHAMRRRM